MADEKRAEVKVPGMRQGFGGAASRFAPGAKPKNARGTFMRIVRIYMRWGKPIFGAVLLTIVSSAIGVAVPYFVGQAFNTFDVGAHYVDSDALLKILAVVAGLHIANWIVTTGSGLIIMRVSQRLVQTLRADFFAKMQRLPLYFYDTRSHGDTMSRLTNDVDNISSTIAQTTTQLVSSVLTICGSLFVMLSLSPMLTLAVIVSVPLVTLLTKTIAKRSRAYFLAQSRSLGALNGVIEENILGLKMVKAFGKQQDVLGEFREINENLYENSRRAQTWAGFLMPLMNVINNLTFTLVAITGGVLSVSFALPVGTVVSFLSYSKQFAFPLNNIAGMFNTIQSALAGAERIFEIMDHAEEPADTSDAVDIISPKGNVAFDSLSFAYEKDKPILENISFEVAPGEVIALVGETGAGKTTVVNLLTRFYDADSGSVLIDGVPITSIKRDSLQRCFSVVLQDTCLFTGSIMDNIRYSKSNASDDEVISAAKLAHAHEFIEKLPGGYNAAVSGNTDNLSQGQRQLLAIARAVLCDSPILILDEATSSVDTKTEKDIQRALVSLMKNRTSFLIAHRLSTIRDADRIMVIGGGKIMECGRHDDLMRDKGRYYEMVVSQLGVSEVG